MHLHARLLKQTILAQIYLAMAPLPVLAQLNCWDWPRSANWEDPHWSLGRRPGPGQTIMITNTGWKAVAINPATRQDFPESLAVGTLSLEAPTDSRNVLLLNWFGKNSPLTIAEDLTVGTNASLLNLNSGLVVQGAMLIRNGAVEHDHAFLYSARGGIAISDGGEFRSVDSEIHSAAIGVGEQGSGAFRQTGGVTRTPALTVGGLRWLPPWVSPQPQEGQATYSLTNGALVCSHIQVGQFRNAAVFHVNSQVVADYMRFGEKGVSGEYELRGGNLTSPVIHLGAGAGSGTFVQEAGTNNVGTIGFGSVASQLDNATYGIGRYCLRGGTLFTKALNYYYSGCFEQTGGIHLTSEPLDYQGFGAFIHQVYTVSYKLDGGVLRAPALTLRALCHFDQGGGECFISGPVQLLGHSIRDRGVTTALSVSNGFFSCQELAASNADINHKSGVLVCTNSLTISGYSVYSQSRWPEYGMATYYLDQGTLVSSNINIAASMKIASSSQPHRIRNDGSFAIDGGFLYIGEGNERLGALLVRSGAVLTFTSGSTVLRFAHSSTSPWGGILTIREWRGSRNGLGEDQLIFGTGNSGLTSPQLRQITFTDPFGFPPGTYSAKILPTGEVVPTLEPWLNPLVYQSDMILYYATNCILQSSANVSGPYYDVYGAASPFTNSMLESPIRFFRLRLLQ